MSVAVAAAEYGWLPDWLVRVGIRALLRDRLRAERARHDCATGGSLESRLVAMRNSPIALSTTEANKQHYEVPADFFRLVLGPHLKYSCCSWSNGALTLGAAEAAALHTITERAEVGDGMRVLDLGCGWGALSFWVAEHFPGTQVLAVSNSDGQRRHIESECRRRNIVNLRVVTADVNHFVPDDSFDRVVSVEMFEHMRNYERLVTRIASWLRPGGALFVHTFCHKKFCYFFEDDGESDWMARHFFTGGMMPSRDLLTRCSGPLEVQQQWTVSGEDYARTATAWLKNLDGSRREAERVLQRAGALDSRRELERWRLFFMACAELFGFADGDEWFVVHHRLRLKSVEAVE